MKTTTIILSLLLLLIISLGFTYLATAFVNAEFNPFKWKPVSRSSMVGIGLTVFVVLLIALLPSIDLNKKR